MGCLSLTLSDGERVFVTHKGETGFVRASLVNEPGCLAHDCRVIPRFPPTFTIYDCRDRDTRFFVDRGQDTLRVAACLYFYRGMAQVRVIFEGDWVWEITREQVLSSSRVEERIDRGHPLSLGLKSRLPSVRRGSPSDAKP